jgi:hypothetical protein
VTRRALVAVVILGLAAAAVVLYTRVRVEARYRAVEIVLDGDDWTTLIRREGRRIDDVLPALRERGATSVALADNTLKRMAEEGRVSYASGASLAAAARLTPLATTFARLQAAGAIRPGAVYVAADPEPLAFVEARLRALLGTARVRRVGDMVEALGTQQDIEEIGLGYQPSDAAAARAAGLHVVLRPRNYRGLSSESLRVLVDGYARTAPEPTLIFALTEVQGNEGLIADAAAEYRRVGARFGRIEVFTARRKQRGEDRLTALMRPSVIRVFSITPEELQSLGPDEVADRFVRAAQERNIRLLYVRPLLSTPAGQSPLDVNLKLVDTVARDLQRFGFTPGRSRPLQPLEVPLPVIWIVALGASALMLLVLSDLTAAAGAPLPAWGVWGLMTVATLGGMAASLTRLDPLWRQVLALGVAVAGATGATVWALPDPPRHAARSVVVGWIVLIRALLVAVGAAFFVAALLSQWPFMLAFSTFAGVKAAHVAPVVLVGAWLALGRHGRSDGKSGWRDLAVWINQPLRLGTMLAVLVAGLIGVMLLVRTGNVGLPLSGVEQQLRGALEQWLVARPRTKEFLLGYPALVLAGLAAARGWRWAAIPLAMAGAIGTAGAINSFSHLHTPLVHTIWRTGNALALGAILAIPAAVVLLWIGPRIPRS